MKVYIDSEYKCHITNSDNTFSEIDTSFFNGKCNTFIEGYRFIPSGESWTRFDGMTFYGEMATPWKPYYKLEDAQIKYERQKLSQYENMQLELNASYNEGINSI